ncbi:MAG: methyl-accepting chemotaxis protein [Planctomycetota bacterium]|jgi:methyl-accepting chemotaxis protein
MMRWTIGKKLIAGFLFVSGLVAVAGGVGMWGLNRVGSEADNISDVQIPLADCSMEAEIALISSQDAAGEVVSSDDLKEIEGFEQEIEDKLAEFDMFMTAIRSGTKDERGEWTADFSSARVEGGTNRGQSFRSVWQAQNEGTTVYRGSSTLVSLAEKADAKHETFTRAARELVRNRKDELAAEARSNVAMEELDAGSEELAGNLVALERHAEERFQVAKQGAAEIAAKGSAEAKQVSALLDQVLVQDINLADVAMEMKASLYALRDACGELLRIEAAASVRGASIAQAEAEVKKYTDQFEAAYLEFQGLELDAGEKTLNAEIRADFNKLKEQVATMVKSHKEHVAMARAVKKSMVELDGASAEIGGMTHEIEQAAETDMDTAMASADSAQTTATASLVVTTIAGIIVGMILGILISRSISIPIGKVVKAAEMIADGDLSSGDITVSSQDEVGQLAGAFNRMTVSLNEMAEAAGRISDGDLTVKVNPKSERDVLGNAFARMSTNLESTVSQIISTAEQVRTASGDVSTTAQQSAAGAQQQQKGVEQISSQTGEVSSQMEEVSSQIEEMASGIEQASATVDSQVEFVDRVSTTMEEMGASVQSVTENAGKAQAQGGSAVEEARKGREAVQAATSGMEAISSTIDGLATVINSLGLRSSQIGEIVDTITGIASQTNLLALNAAIEAARAGEHGRGFAVVADEVRKLAERTAQATEEIESLVKGIQDESQNAVRSTEEGIEKVKQGGELTANVGTVLESVVGSIQDTSEAIQGILASTDEQSKAAKDVAGAVTELSGMSKQIAKGMAEQSKGAQQISQAVAQTAKAMEETAASVEEIGGITNQVAAGAQEMASSAEELSAQSEGMRELMAQFTLSNGGGRATAAEASSSGSAARRTARQTQVGPRKTKQKNEYHFAHAATADEGDNGK